MPAVAVLASGPFDELMLRRAQRGDESAWRALIERYQVPVHAVVWRMLAGRELHRAEDLVQETFLRVLRALPAFDPAGPASLATWILTIATPSGGTFHRKFDGEPTVPVARNVAPKDLENNRIKGDRNIIPDDYDQRAMEREVKVIAAIKVCIDRSGKVSMVRMLKSSGYPGYDRKIETEVMTWEYRPFENDGTPVPVCTGITFIYTQT